MIPQLRSNFFMLDEKKSLKNIQLSIIIQLIFNKTQNNENTCIILLYMINF